jgi:16S rRNA (uracil1498-N3)-methyltransferase
LVHDTIAAQRGKGIFGLHRFYVSQRITGETASISDSSQLHHLRDVLRLKIGDEVCVFDSEGTEYLGAIEKLAREQAVFRIQNRKPAPVKKWQLAVACAIPKKSRLDDIIDKLTQLGVDVIIPLETERAVVKLETKEADRLERWRKIARNAAEQSRRSSLPLIPAVLSLPKVLAQAKNYRLKLVPTLAGDRKPLREILAESKADSILALVGPEGDFTPQEIEQARAAGFIPVSLGATVLRVETAAIAIAAFIRLALDG